LIALNLDVLLTPLLEAGNQMAYYTALLVGSNHPGFRFLMKHPYPETEYVMASLHPESETDEPRFFEKIRMLKESGHRVFVRFVTHPKRFHRLDELSERCRDLDVCFYPTALFSNHFPAGYTQSERATLQSHFSSLSQLIQLEGGLDTDGLMCHAGSRVISVNLQTGDITPCITVHKPSLGNIFSDRLEWSSGPAPCPEAGIDCLCDIHFQQDIVVSTPDRSRFVQLSEGYTAPKDYRNEIAALKRDGIRFYAKLETGMGSVADESRLFYTIDEVRENFRKARNLPRSTLNRGNLREVEGALRDIELCDARAEIHTGSPTIIQMPPEQWSWAAAIPLSLPVEVAGEIWLRVRATVSYGEAALGVLTREGKSYQDRCFMSAGAEPQTVFLKISNPADAKSLIVENSTPGGAAAKILLDTVTVLAALA
jgi:hypothetical protein